MLSGLGPEVELRVVPENAILVERYAALGGEVSGNARASGDLGLEREEAGMLGASFFMPLGKAYSRPESSWKVARSTYDVSLPTRCRWRPLARSRMPSEVAQELRRSLGQEAVRALRGFGLLIFVVEAGADGMVGVVDLVHEIGDGEHELVSGDPGGLVVGDEAVARGEVLEDVGRLGDHQRSADEEGRGEGWTPASSLFMIFIMSRTPCGPRATSM